jgi:ribosome biogenesis GTPase / thiamine phosphate phosphatase
MNHSIAVQLAPLGFKSAQLQYWLEANDARWPSRVVSVSRGACEVMGASDARGLVTSRVLVPTGQQPVVGDWVLLTATPKQDPVLDVTFPRQTWLRRAGVGGNSGAQFIASNVDTVFVVAGCSATEKMNERGLNPRRIERLVWVVREGGAHPVVLLNKADLIADAAGTAAVLSRRLGGVQVLPISAEVGSGVPALDVELRAGDTIAVIGASGVGKSTLINRLLGEQRQETTSTRDGDAKGRHTTTRRELFIAPSGALVIDTPGMREIALFSEQGEAQGFDDIEALAGACRFHDCEHATEPGCAVRAAIANGECDAERLESYAALKRDALRQASRHDAQARRTLRREQRVARTLKGPSAR